MRKLLILGVLCTFLPNLVGCGAQNDSSDKVPPDGEPTTPEDLFVLESGTYEVSNQGMAFNDCEADFDYFDGREWPVQIIDDEIDIASIIVQRDGNTISGTESEVVDWNWLGWDCQEEMAYVYEGEVLGDNEFTWVWNGTWSTYSGTQCAEMSNSPVYPCSYSATFLLQKIDTTPDET